MDIQNLKTNLKHFFIKDPRKAGAFRFTGQAKQQLGSMFEEAGWDISSIRSVESLEMAIDDVFNHRVGQIASDPDAGIADDLMKGVDAWEEGKNDRPPETQTSPLSLVEDLFN